MRFAIFSDNTINQINGAAEVNRQLVRILSYYHHEILLIIPAESIQITKATNVLVEVVSLSFWNYPECRISLPFSCKAFNRLKSFDPDFLITTTPFGIGQMGLLFKKLYNKPLLNFFLTDFAALNKYYGHKWLESILKKTQISLCENAYINFAPSLYVKQKLLRYGILNVKTFELGLGNEYFEKFKNIEMSNEYREKRNILYVGRVAADKNISWLIDFVLKSNNAMLTVAGDGPEAANYKNLPDDKVRFLGYVKGKELAILYKKTDLFVMPSLEEVGGMAINEAIYSRVPVFIFNGKATAEIVNKYKVLSFRTRNEFYSELMNLTTGHKLNVEQVTMNTNSIEDNWDLLYSFIIDSCFEYKTTMGIKPYRRELPEIDIDGQAVS